MYIIQYYVFFIMTRAEIRRHISFSDSSSYFCMCNQFSVIETVKPKYKWKHLGFSSLRNAREKGIIILLPRAAIVQSLKVSSLFHVSVKLTKLWRYTSTVYLMRATFASFLGSLPERYCKLKELISFCLLALSCDLHWSSSYLGTTLILSVRKPLRTTSTLLINTEIFQNRRAVKK